ncbi:protein kinase [Infirmifilum lucidum]|uniref:Protein kinase n=1 Tax=Infirmifilum lucidum TaxID=2776706 RepID=A0A7L9FJI8_9CREN|nr:serine/threonine-protein kinase [Infirmifilum lucidum]QOJ78955.1 protein kinase [Infirmifilum lucidum]
MMELAIQKAQLIDAPVRKLFLSFAVDSHGQVYKLHPSRPPERLTEALGEPVYFHEAGERLVFYTKSRNLAVLSPPARLERYVLESVPDQLTLTGEGFAMSQRHPKKVAASLVKVVGSGYTLEVESPRILSMASVDNNLYALTMTGEVIGLAASGSQLNEFLRIRNLPRGCTRVVAVGDKIAVKCQENIACFDAYTGKALWMQRVSLGSLLAWGNYLVLWEPEETSLELLSVEDGSLQTLSFKPVFTLFTAGGRLYVVQRYVVTALSAGLARENMLLPIPIPENMSVHNVDFYFSVSRWIASCSPTPPSVVVEKVSVKPAEGKHRVYITLSARTPSSNIPISNAEAVVKIGGIEVSSVSDEKGRIVVETELPPGSHSLQVRLRGLTPTESELGVVETVTEHEVDVPEDTRPLGLSVGDFLDDKYSVRELLGEGGFGGVFRALDILLERRVAIKVPHGHFSDYSVLLEEASKLVEVSKRVNRESHVVTEVYDVKLFRVKDLSHREKGEVFAIVMEFVEGGSLRNLLAGSSLTSMERRSIALKLAEKVALLNERKVVHGDLKPENILLTGEKNPILADFYTATLLGRFEKMRKLRKLVFSRLYAPPELINSGIVSEKTDSYSLGVTLIELLTGRAPAPGSIPAPLLEAKTIPDKCKKKLIESLSPDPHERPTTREIYEALQDTPST